MAPLIITMLETHDVTVVATSASCGDKLAPIRKEVSFELIEKDLTFTEIHFEDYFDMITKMFVELPIFFEKLYRGMKDFLVANRKKYDVMIVDGTQEGALLAAEVVNIPTAMIMSGVPRPVENVLEELNVTIKEILGSKIVRLFCSANLFRTLRSENSLPDYVSQGHFYDFEYPSRFPAMIMMSPTFYPNPHQSVPAIFVGASRQETLYDSISSSLMEWLDQNNDHVLYLSLSAPMSP